MNDSDNTPFPLWGSLTSGPYAVGFHTEWRTDAARLYQTSWEPATTPRPRRPILVAVWYPATPGKDTARMAHREYLNLPEGDATALRFRDRLITHCRDITEQEVMEKPVAEWNAEEAAAFEDFFNAPTAAVRDAEPLAERFPLLLSHSGLGAAYADNAVLHEYLASHGYTIVCSAFQKEWADEVNINGDLDRSVKDLDFLVRTMADAPNADTERLGAFGHSYGAQSVLAWRSESNSPVQAVVSMDSTMEYQPDDECWNKLRQRIERIERMTSPLFLFAGNPDEPPPDFKVTDALIHAERFYATVTGINHNDYLCHGGIGAELRGRLRGDSPPFPVRAAYDEICRHVLRFFDATLKGDANARAALLSAAQSGEESNGLKIVRHLPAQ